MNFSSVLLGERQTPIQKILSTKPHPVWSDSNYSLLDRLMIFAAINGSIPLAKLAFDAKANLIVLFDKKTLTRWATKSENKHMVPNLYQLAQLQSNSSRSIPAPSNNVAQGVSDI